MSESGHGELADAPEVTVGTAFRYRGDAGVRLVGEIDSSNAAVLRGALALLADVADDVYLDLSELTFIDVSGLHLLVGFAGAHAPHRVVLEGASDLIRRIFGSIWTDSGLELS